MKPKITDQNPSQIQANKLYQTGVLLIHGKRKSVDKAIKCIQKAITFDDKDYKYWQLLGEAYYQRGSLNPAINCFMKSLKLAEENDPSSSLEKRSLIDCTYSRLRMSDIRLSVGHLEEAVRGYSDIISSDPNNVGALIGLSKANLAMSRNCFSSGLVISGHSHSIEALKYSLKSIKLCPQLATTWKLASDCCLIQFIYGQRGPYETVIDEDFPGCDSDGKISINRMVCIELAQQFLCKALSFPAFRRSGCLWHNLGISLYMKSTLINDSRKNREILKRSLRCLLKALDLERNSSQIYNSIGVVTFKLNLLDSAQKIFIKSIQTNLSTSEIQFSNLGYMYLNRGELRLASVAFNRSQAEEPLYVRSWLGNALVSEHQNLSNISHLRHCNRLDNNYESQLLFATSVTTLPMIDDYEKDLNNALDSMKRTINYNQHSIESCNTLGLLYERCNHFDQARSYFEKAYNLNKTDSRVIFNCLRQHCASKSCWTNDSIEPASEELIKAAERLSKGGNLQYIFNFIYYLFNNSDYNYVNLKITQLIEKIPQSDLKSKLGSQILLGLAAKAEGKDYKSWFFKNIIDSENITSIEKLINLLCLMLSGALTDDTELVQRVSSDLPKVILNYISSKKVQFDKLFYSREGLWIRLAIFFSIFCFDDKSKFVKSLVALFPTAAELWMYLGLSMTYQKNKQQTALYCIQQASLIGSTFADLTMICDILTAILVTTNKNQSNPIEMRKKYLSRALFKYPNHSLIWTCLVNIKDLKTQEKQKRARMFDDSNASLFQLAIDHIIRLVIV